MLSWSVRRRLTYLAIVLMLVAIVGVVLLIIFQPVPSCFDGKQNQDEVGIDCGGSCSKVCAAEIVPLRVVWTRLFEIDEGKYDLAALVKNANLRHGAQAVKYVFRIWNSDNLLINNRRGVAFLNPKEDMIIYESRIDTGKWKPARVAFEFEEAPIWQRIDTEAPKLTFSAKRFVNEPEPRLSAQIKNPSLSSVTDITVLAILSDKDQNAIAVSSTYLEELPAGGSKEVVFTWPRSFDEAVAFVDLTAHFDWRQLAQQ